MAPSPESPLQEKESTPPPAVSKLTITKTSFYYLGNTYGIIKGSCEVLRKTSLKIFIQGRLGSTAVKRLPSAQGYGIETHIRLLHYEPASPSPTPPACVPSLAGCLYLCQINK